MTEDERHKEILRAIENLTIAVGSLNSDPAKTIGEYRKEEKLARLLSLYAAITSTIAIVLTTCDFIF